MFVALICLFVSVALGDTSTNVTSGFDLTSYPHGNPFVTGVYGYPYAIAFDGTYWIYHTNFPQDRNNSYINAYSSQDLRTWQIHNVLSKRDFKWATGPIYSAAIANRTGSYYLYFTTTVAASPSTLSIGVGTAKTPDGPFMDKLGGPLVNTGNIDVDPASGLAVLTIKDETLLYYISSGSLKIAQLNTDMTTLVGPPIDPKNNTDNPTTLPVVAGGINIFSRGTSNLTYYFTFRENNCNDKLHYAMSTDPSGPFKNMGKVFEADKALATSFGQATVLNVPNTDFWYMVYSRALTLDDGWPDPSLSGLAYERMRFDDGSQPAKISLIKMAVYDDFEDPEHDGEIWTKYLSKSYTNCLANPENPAGHMGLCTQGDGDGRAMMHNNFSDFNYSISALIDWAGQQKGNNTGAALPTDASTGVVFRVTNPLLGGGAPNSTNFEGYYAGVTADKKIMLGKMVGGMWQMLQMAPLDPNFDILKSWFQLKVKAMGQNIQVFVNDMSMPKINTNDPTYSSGQTGVRTWNTPAKFQELLLYSLP